LPNEALLSFEGSGVETGWELEFSSIANPNGLDNVADVLLTFDTRAYYSPELHQKHLDTLPTSIQRFVLISTMQHQPESIETLKSDASKVELTFDPTAIGLPQREQLGTIQNLVLFLVGGEPLTFTASFSSTKMSDGVDISFERNIAISHAPPFDGSGPASGQLNTFVNQEVLQTFRLAINKGSAPGVDFSQVTDVIFGVEYQASLQ
jgi:hypothetical protein